MKVWLTELENRCIRSLALDEVNYHGPIKNTMQRTRVPGGAPKCPEQVQRCLMSTQLDTKMRTLRIRQFFKLRRLSARGVWKAWDNRGFAFAFFLADVHCVFQFQSILMSIPRHMLKDGQILSFNIVHYEGGFFSRSEVLRKEFPCVEKFKREVKLCAKWAIWNEVHLS